MISGTPTVSGTFTYTVTVNDGHGHTGTNNCSITVTPAPPINVTCAAITISEGVQMTPVPLAASGGYPGATLTFSATGLPAGISISQSGVVSGTPTVKIGSAS